ncbi:MAG: hypothetical protein JO122_07195 [Acetobacteraceae bacterium]|nr:hypothetical protein [Acetobacteraceae bacterium]
MDLFSFDVRRLLRKPVRRVNWRGVTGAAMADALPGTIALDLMRPSPIMEDDNNYWDALHDRVGVAARVASDVVLAAGDRMRISGF